MRSPDGPTNAPCFSASRFRAANAGIMGTGELKGGGQAAALRRGTAAYALPPESAYIAGAAGAAAFFAARRLAGFFAALRAGFRVAFFATFRFAVFFFALRPAFFAVLRPGFLAPALRTGVRFLPAFLRAGFLFAVIGIETTPSRDGRHNTRPPKTSRNMRRMY